MRENEKRKACDNEVKSQFFPLHYVKMFHTQHMEKNAHLPVVCAATPLLFPPPPAPDEFASELETLNAEGGTRSKRGRAISTSLEKCFKHVNAVILSASHSIVCCFGGNESEKSKEKFIQGRMEWHRAALTCLDRLRSFEDSNTPSLTT